MCGSWVSLFACEAPHRPTPQPPPCREGVGGWVCVGLHMQKEKPMNHTSKLAPLAILTSLALAPRVLVAQEIRVEADTVLGRVSPYLTGACIEDVNHEIYGGLYSQMLFGESFQEPPRVSPVQGFAVHGGSWTLEGEELHGGAGDGPKLIREDLTLTKGEVGVEVFFVDRQAGNAGLILKVG